VPYGAFLCGCETTFESGAVLQVNGNHATGIRVLDGSINWSGSCNGALVMEDGVQCEIMNNNSASNPAMSKQAGEISGLDLGGGIWVNGTAVLPKDAKIYNNHALTAGDDIFVEESGKLSFGNVGNDWTLDDCGDTITGWFYDGVNAGVETARWNVSGCIDGRDEFISLYTIAASDASNVALKAAHAVVEDEVIDDDDTPLAGPDDKPSTDKPSTDKPSTDEVIEDNETPLAGPDTGDNFAVTALIVVMVLSALGVTVLVLTKKKQDNI
jgi:hypothetical protein